MEDKKVCDVINPSLEYGNCEKALCCRTCELRRECVFPCQLSYGEKCKYYKGEKWE